MMLVARPPRRGAEDAAQERRREPVLDRIVGETGAQRGEDASGQGSGGRGPDVAGKEARSDKMRERTEIGLDGSECTRPRRAIAERLPREVNKAFWEQNPAFADAKEPVLAWYRHALRADWASPAEVKADF